MGLKTKSLKCLPIIRTKKNILLWKLMRILIFLQDTAIVIYTADNFFPHMDKKNSHRGNL